MTEPMPVFVIKAKDQLAISAVTAYRDLCLDEHLIEQADRVQLAIHEMITWREAHQDLVQVPDHAHVPAALSAPSEPVQDQPRVPATELRRRVVEKLWAEVDGMWRDDAERIVDMVMTMLAPDEPPQGQPRVWQLPTIPEDVKAVRDNEGSVWVRAEEPERWWDRADGRRISAESRLIDERGPLTEVVNTDRPYGVHGPGGYRSSACLHAAEPGREELHLVCQTDAIRYDGSEKVAAQCKYGDGKEPCRCACHEEATDGD